MFGEIGAWLFKGPGGIKPDEKQPGFRNILLEPHFVAGLDSFEASHSGPYGAIVSSWKKTANSVLYKVTVPANSTATLVLDGKKNLYESAKMMMPVSGQAEKNAGSKKIFKLIAGTYQFEIR